jgi:hypothetical protein
MSLRLEQIRLFNTGYIRVYPFLPLELLHRLAAVFSSELLV